MLFLVSVPVVVFAAVEAAYFTLELPIDGMAEQGRYLFTGDHRAVGDRHRWLHRARRAGAASDAARSSSAPGTMSLASQLLMFATFYS